MNKVLPLVDRVCNSLLNGLSPKDKVSLVKFKATMDKINESILARLLLDLSEASG